MKRKIIGYLMVGALLVLSGSSTAWTGAGQPSVYKVIKTVPLGGPERWDYVHFDPATGYVFLAHGDHIDVIEGNTGKIRGKVTGLTGAHGVAIDGKLRRGYADSGEGNSVTVFDLETLKSIAEISTAAGPDAMAFDPASGHVFSMNRRGKNTTVIDPSSNQPVTTVALDGTPESAVADGDGSLYINIEDKNELVRLDTKTNNIRSRWPLTGCNAPHGLAIDTVHRRLFSGCANETMLVLDADQGKIVARLPIGRGSDAIAFNDRRQQVFSSNGFGTVSVYAEKAPDVYHSVAQIPTNLGARTMDLDPTTGRLFLATADVTVHPEEKDIRHRYSVAPGSVRLLMLDPE